MRKANAFSVVFKKIEKGKKLYYTTPLTCYLPFLTSRDTQIDFYLKKKNYNNWLNIYCEQRLKT